MEFIDYMYCRSHVVVFDASLVERMAPIEIRFNENAAPISEPGEIVKITINKEERQRCTYLP